MKQPGTKDSHKDKMARNPIKIYPSVPQKKPSWLKYNFHILIALPKLRTLSEITTFIQFVKKRAVPILENALVKVQLLL